MANVYSSYELFFEEKIILFVLVSKVHSIKLSKLMTRRVVNQDHLNQMSVYFLQHWTYFVYWQNNCPFYFYFIKFQVLPLIYHILELIFFDIQLNFLLSSLINFSSGCFIQAQGFIHHLVVDSKIISTKTYPLSSNLYISISFLYIYLKHTIFNTQLLTD